MAKRVNVGQHVVPICYLKHFGGEGGTIQVQDKAGKTFACGPEVLCKEKDIYTLLVNGTRDFSLEAINNQVESALGPILRELSTRVDVGSTEAKRRIFTHLAALTANLIARSRVLRAATDKSLDLINEFLSNHPDLFNDFPEEQYQRFLRNPQAFPALLAKFPGGDRYLGILRDVNEHTPPPSGVAETIECLKTVKRVQYQLQLAPRTEGIASLMVDIGARADLLTSTEPRFVSADDPVVFLTKNMRATTVVPTDVAHWTESNRSVYLPLNSHVAVLWSVAGNYTAKSVAPDEVHLYNAMMKQNAIRHIFASDCSDFGPRTEGQC